MKKVILMPDSFKGTMSSSEICSIMKARVLEHFSDCKVESIPVADGGEGTVDCFLEAMKGERVTISAKGPFMEDIKGFYAIVENGNTAIIEMAATAGLPMVYGRENPRITTTFGVGQLIRDAVSRGCKRIVVGLGGSCTNDMGVGAAAGAGAIFRDKNGEQFIPTGATLSKVASIDLSELKELLSGVEIVAMCDIDNVLYGPTGAAYVFSPQKGADPDTVKLLDDNLRICAETVKRELGIDVATLAGAGAAGGMGAGMVAFFGATLKAGIETVLDTVGFDRIAADADLILTGEGKIDSQSLEGKVVCGVAKRSLRKGVPVVAIVGGIDGDISPIYELGVNSVFAINRMPEDFSVSRYKSRENLRATVDDILRILKI